MHFDTIGTLCGESHGDRHEFLVLLRDCSIGKRSLVVGAESGHSLWGELAHLGQLIQIFFGVHIFLVPFSLPASHLQPRVAMTSRYSASTLVVLSTALLCADHRLTSSVRRISCPGTWRDANARDIGP